jgi:N-acetylglutamate synthase-like GNAT family acetyltransferase
VIRKILVHEVAGVKSLIDPFVKEGLMLPKSLHSLYTCVRDFWVVCGEHDPGRSSAAAPCRFHGPIWPRSGPWP